MVGHIQGRGPSLTPAGRPHFLAKELQLYLDHAESAAARAEGPKALQAVEQFRKNLLAGLAHYRELSRGPAFPGENLDSLRVCLDEAEARLARLAAPQEPSARRPGAAAAESRASSPSGSP